MTIDIYRETPEDGLSLGELGLYHDIMDYRASVGLAPIPLSRGLTTTAGRHVADIRENVWAEGRYLPPGGLHGWSDARYDADRSPEAMHDAPTRLGTGYPGEGHEISIAGTVLDADSALDGWKHSPGHNALLVEEGGWADPGFAAIGIGFDTSPGPGVFAGRSFTVWFGDVADPTGAPPINGTGQGDRIEATAFADRVRGHGGGDRIDGGAGRDRLSGNRGDDRIDGGRGNDRLHGGGGDDWLRAGAGHDHLSGNAGADRLVAGRGHDELTGGGGPDTFVFNGVRAAGTGKARDVVTDFTPGADKLDLSGIDADPGRRGQPGLQLRRPRLRRGRRIAALLARRRRRRPRRRRPAGLRDRDRAARPGCPRLPALTFPSRRKPGL